MSDLWWPEEEEELYWQYVISESTKFHMLGCKSVLYLASHYIKYSLKVNHMCC